MSKLILFQGDSITDVSRKREDDRFLGHGYPMMVSGELGFHEPGKYRFLNRGVSGNRIVDLYARMKLDLINLKPDVLSILIGVNDVWHELAREDGVSEEKFERVYDWLLAEIKEALPKIQLLILEPFIIPGAATKSTQECPEKWELFRCEVEKRADAAGRVAQKHGACFVSLQNRFDEACRKADPEYWSIDGVHPTAMGHELIARAWMEGFYRCK